MVEHGKVCVIYMYNRVPYYQIFTIDAATECRTFLLYYLPILRGILPDKYLAHALLLSKAIRLLLSDNVSNSDIDVSEHVLEND